MKGSNAHPWRVHTPALLAEILSNSQTAILRQPINIFRSLLVEVGERAIELNDPTLNSLMLRLTIYSAADPNSPDYDPKLLSACAHEAKRKERTK